VSLSGCETQYIGYNADATAGFRHADNFQVVHVPGWRVDQIHLYAFAPGGAASISPVAAANLRIWDGPPGEPGATAVWGDTATNRLAAVAFSRIYKFSTAYPVFRLTLDVGVHLGPGEYWIDYAMIGSGNTSVFAPFVTLPGALGKPGANARFSSDAGETWEPVFDEPVPTGSCQRIPQDFPFAVLGAVLPHPECWANCDQSTAAPVLNINDFTCFLNSFALASELPHAQQIGHYANCDGSTTAPVLNVDDFICFINRFAEGCP
jgi:hypothetical protein